MDSVVFLKNGQLPPLTPEMIQWVENALPEQTHPERAQSFLLSRFALKMAMEKVLGREVFPDELGLKNHHQIEAYPKLFVSLSHTKDAACAWVREQSGHGIDLERLDRPLKDAIWERVHHSEDEASLSRIELWCLKEAAFKALFNAHHINGPIAFKEIQFKKDGVWHWKAVTGHYLTSIEDNQWQLARAWF